jgi:hypothetical protein
MLLAAKNPFFVATTPGHTVAVGDTWPNVTLSRAQAGATAANIKPNDAVANR